MLFGSNFSLNTWSYNYMIFGNNVLPYTAMLTLFIYLGDSLNLTDDEFNAFLSIRAQLYPTWVEWNHIHWDPVVLPSTSYQGFLYWLNTGWKHLKGGDRLRICRQLTMQPETLNEWSPYAFPQFHCGMVELYIFIWFW